MEPTIGQLYIDTDGRVWECSGQVSSGKYQFHTDRPDQTTYWRKYSDADRMPTDWRPCWRGVTPAAGQVWKHVGTHPRLEDIIITMGVEYDLHVLHKYWVCLTPPAESELAVRLEIAEQRRERMADAVKKHLAQVNEEIHAALMRAELTPPVATPTTLTVADLVVGEEYECFESLGEVARVVYKGPSVFGLPEFLTEGGTFTVADSWVPKYIRPRKPAPAQAPAPTKDRCAYATLQVTGDVTPEDFYARFGRYKNDREGAAQVLTEQRRQAQRTLREWPTCRITGKPVEFMKVHPHADDMIFFGLICPECSK